MFKSIELAVITTSSIRTYRDYIEERFLATRQTNGVTRSLFLVLQSLLA